MATIHGLGFHESQFPEEHDISPASNSLLAELPENELQALTRHLQLVSLQKGQSLFNTGEIPGYVYFPIGAIVSVVIDSDDGLSTEAFMLGKTCMVGVGIVNQPSYYRALVRDSGLAYRMPTSVFLQIRSACPTYIQNAIAATHRMLIQLSQAIVCSKRHSTDAQLIRWLLITLDRGMDNAIPITHQQLADILGFRREAITHHLGRMCERGDIQVLRGEICVLNRTALEARACSCYWAGQERPRPTFNGPLDSI